MSELKIFEIIVCILIVVVVVGFGAVFGKINFLIAEWEMWFEERIKKKTMARYIDADELLNGIYSENPQDVMKYIAEFPAADVRETVRGVWIHDKDDEIISGICSYCGWESIICETDVADMSFCPNCGADMRSQDVHGD